MRCTGVTYFLPYRQIRLEIKRGTLAELRLADQSNDYSASADDEEYEEDEEMILEYYPVSGADCATAQLEAIFDPRSVGDIKLPGQFSQ